MTDPPAEPRATGERHVVIVGGGPTAVYAVGHLLAELSGPALQAPLRVSVFDRARAGAGEVHDDRQVRTSYLNRISAQITFAADESHRGLRALLPRRLRPTFHEWVRRRYAETGNPDFDLSPYDVPRRYVHGLALRDMFRRYAERLAALPGVTLDVHRAEVTDVVATADASPLRVHSDDRSWAADHVLFATGHSHNRAAVPAPATLTDAYPLDHRITEAEVPPGTVLGVRGLGLTAFDVILHVTEGRGGRFVGDETTGALRYVRSGREPASIVGVSPSGVPVSGRACNRKIVDPDRLQHRAVFFTEPAIRRLRDCDDVLGVDPRGRLDFDRHLLPLVILEMAYVYYRTLLGDGFAERIRRAVAQRYQAFLSGTARWGPAGTDHLLEPVQAAFGWAAARIHEPGPERDAFRRVLHAPPPDGRPPEYDASEAAGSPWGHSLEIRDHRFDWRTVLEPLPEPVVPTDSWSTRSLEFLRRDLRFCAQGNVDNPLKAACDGVWRDLRGEFGAAVDHGGLRPDSHRRFVRVHLRHYNRLSNGAGLEPMRKIIALAECGLLDLAVGPRPRIVPGADGVRLTGPATGVTRQVAVLVEARVHPFDPVHDVSPLYANLIRHGLVRQWRNRGSAGQADFLPGALDLDAAYHPVGADPAVAGRLTFLGAPADGLRLFQLSLARPQAGSCALNSAARWAEEVVDALVRVSGSAAAADHRVLEVIP